MVYRIVNMEIFDKKSAYGRILTMRRRNMIQIKNGNTDRRSGLRAGIGFFFMAATAISITAFGMGLSQSHTAEHLTDKEPFSVRRVSNVETMPMKYVRWYDSKMNSGTEKVIYNGTHGKEIVTVDEYLCGDTVIHRDVVSRYTVEAGTVGAKRCGDRTNTVGRVVYMEATAYHPTDGDGLGITATGTKAGRGTVAVDPDVIDLGSSVYVPGYGMAVATDTGGDIIGNRIDLCMEEFDECWEFGRRDVEVFVAEK